MSKELEALKRIKRLADVMYKEDYELLEQALSTPTEEQVCEALGKWMRVKVWFEDNSFCYKGYEVLKMTYLCEKGVIIDITYNLPPDLLIMVAKFYKGALEK